MNVRKRIFNIISVSDGTYNTSRVYDLLMMCVIIASLIPLAFKGSNAAFLWIERISTSIFIFDYVLRLLVADYTIGKGAKSFFIYPFTFLAIIDLVSIFPSFAILSSGFKILKIFRLFRTFRVFRAFKMLRYSKSFLIISNVMKKQKEPLIAVCVLACAYILLSALVVFNVEPDTFNTFFDAIYWAAVSLTTMGYGDIYPVSTAGRIVTMISSFIGIAIVALPAGIITAGYMDVINQDKK